MGCARSEGPVFGTITQRKRGRGPGAEKEASQGAGAGIRARESEPGLRLLLRDISPEEHSCFTHRGAGSRATFETPSRLLV